MSKRSCWILIFASWLSLTASLLNWGTRLAQKCSSPSLTCSGSFANALKIDVSNVSWWFAFFPVLCQLLLLLLVVVVMMVAHVVAKNMMAGWHGISKFDWASLSVVISFKKTQLIKEPTFWHFRIACTRYTVATVMRFLHLAYASYSFHQHFLINSSKIDMSKV